MKTTYRNNFPKNDIKDIDGATATLDIWYLDQDQDHEFIASEHYILFVISGNIGCSLQGYGEENIEKGQMIFVSMSIRCRIKVIKETIIICVKPGIVLNITNFSFHKKQQDRIVFRTKNQQPVLEFNPLIKAYVESLKNFIDLGFNNSTHIYLKTRELLHLMAVSYSLDQRMHFFQALISKDKEFSDFIYRNYREVESVSGLAALYCLSLSGFEKRFRKVFGVSALHWITLRKAADIYLEISNNHKSIKQISSDYGFSSVSHFHKFCKAKLGLSPGYMRKQAQES